VFLEITLVASGGGHTSFAVALGERLLELEQGIRLNILVPRGDFFSVKRVAGRLKTRNLTIAFTLKPLNPQERLYKIIARAPASMVEALAVVKKTSAVVCTGSNHSLPPSLIGLLAERTPVFCVEDPYRIYGKSRSVSLVHRLGGFVFLQWREQEKLYKSRGLYAGPIYERPVYKPESKGYVLVMTGTMGHRLLFKTLIRGGLKGRRLVVQAGRLWAGYLRRMLPGNVVFDYDPDIDKWVSGADVVVTHQGVAAIQASQAYGKPVVLAYNPDITLAGGLRDAEFVARRLNAVFLTPDPEKPGLLDEAVEAAYGRKPSYLGDGALRAAKTILELVKGVEHLGAWGGV
jgi:UDP-N-acetylglucosamine:LPS N-acetylglucosamine transferase